MVAPVCGPLAPGVGAHRLTTLEPEHLERLYGRMLKAGSASATAHQAHRTIRTALNETVHRGHPDPKSGESREAAAADRGGDSAVHGR